MVMAICHICSTSTDGRNIHDWRIVTWNIRITKSLIIDRLYYGGHHRGRLDLVSFRDVTNAINKSNGEYGALKLNMAYERQMMEHGIIQIPINLNPRSKLITTWRTTMNVRLSEESVLPKLKGTMIDGSRKDKQMRRSSTHQFDKNSQFNEEKKIHQLLLRGFIDNNFGD